MKSLDWTLSLSLCFPTIDSAEQLKTLVRGEPRCKGIQEMVTSRWMDIWRSLDRSILILKNFWRAEEVLSAGRIFNSRILATACCSREPDEMTVAIKMTHRTGYQGHFIYKFVKHLFLESTTRRNKLNIANMRRTTGEEDERKFAFLLRDARQMLDGVLDVYRTRTCPKSSATRLYITVLNTWKRIKSKARTSLAILYEFASITNMLVSH